MNETLFFTAGLFFALLGPACGGDDAYDDDAPADAGGDAGPGDAGGGDAGGPDCDDRSASAPRARADHAAVWVASREEMIVWGGDVGVPEACIPSPEYVDETWVFESDCNTWRQEEAGGGPGARARMSAVHDESRNRLLVFGGRSQAGAGVYEQHGDVWALDLDSRGWSEVETTGTGPSPRSNAVAVLDAERDRLVVFGGNTSTSGASFSPRSDTFALDLSSDEWTEIAAGGGPPARLFHAAALTPDAAGMVVHSGGDENAFLGPFLRDAWLLDLAGGDVWAEIDAPGVTPMARISGAMITGADRILLFGGHDDGTLGNTNETWALDAAAPTWDRVEEGDVLDDTDVGFCDFPPDFTVQDLTLPERRSAFSLVPDGAGGAYLFGGKTDCGNANDVWRLDLGTGAWTELRIANQGLSCQRQGQIGCGSYCL